MSFRSTIGLTVMNTSCAVGENVVSDAATKASASEHTHTRSASRATATTARTRWAATASTAARGISTFTEAAIMAPNTKNPPAWTKSCAAVSRNTDRRSGPRSCAPTSANDSQLGLARATQIQPMTSAASSEATNRATAIIRRPGNAITVATSTTGLIAGAASRKVSAAAGCVPRRISEQATGTEAHSQPGSTMPAIPAASTWLPGRYGRNRRKASAGTNAASSAETITPSTRNGAACAQRPTTSANHVFSCGVRTVHGPILRCTRAAATNPASGNATGSTTVKVRSHRRSGAITDTDTPTCSHV
jgi:hypothetical protein